jgi:aspartyl-tRNA(Asn)/glutamyl-tRNA(Gln) amidotransferase subunit A
MPVSDIVLRPASELAAALRRRAFSVRELVDMFIARIERHDPLCRAYITVTPEDARRRADWCDQNRNKGLTASPFFGIPFAAKDMIDIAGVATTAGSRVLRGNVATRDAAVVSRLFAAGAVSLGKTNLHEFAYGTTGCNEIYGTPRNAYDPARLACGSSSGSATAVAHGLAAAALGTDTGGSTRIPAVLNGLVGLKPTMGSIPTKGVLPFAWSLDHVGLIARTVGDCRDLLAVCTGAARPPFGASERGQVQAMPAGLRIGIPRRFYWEDADPEVLAAGEAVIRFLERAGAVICPVELADPAQARTVSLTIQMPEALSFHSQYLADRQDLYGDDLRSGLALGQFILAEHYVRAKRFLTVYRAEMRAVFDTVDLLLTPATPVPAPELGATTIRLGAVDVPVGNALARYTSFFNMTGNPALSLPCAMHSAGVPVGIQLVGRLREEDLVLQVATAIEAAFSGAVPAPPADAY